MTSLVEDVARAMDAAPDCDCIVCAVNRRKARAAISVIAARLRETDGLTALAVAETIFPRCTDARDTQIVKWIARALADHLEGK